MADPQHFSAQGHGHGRIVQFESGENLQYNFLISPSSVHLSHENETEFSAATFEAPTLYTFTSSPFSCADSPDYPPSPDSEPSPDSSLPELYSRKPATRLRSGNRVPRPRNAFMIFRSEFWAGDKISSSVERDHRHISRIIGHCWNQLSEAEKDVWRRKAEQEKVEHNLRYPGYRFSPNIRKKKPVKRKVKRNGKEELLRCKQVAALILSGKEGVELDTAVQSLGTPEPQLETNTCNKNEAEALSALAPVSNIMQSENQPDYRTIPPSQEPPAFRSPLLPPAVPTNSPPSMGYVGTDTLVTGTESHHIVGGYTQHSYWNASSHLELPEYHIVNTAHSDVVHQQTSTAHITGQPTYFQFQNYQISSSLDPGYHPAPAPTLVSHITFRNPFEFPSTYLPYINRPRSPLDPLQWDLTGFAI